MCWIIFLLDVAFSHSLSTQDSGEVEECFTKAVDFQHTTLWTIDHFTSATFVFNIYLPGHFFTY